LHRKLQAQIFHQHLIFLALLLSKDPAIYSI